MLPLVGVIPVERNALLARVQFEVPTYIVEKEVQLLKARRPIRVQAGSEIEERDVQLLKAF